MRNIYSVTGGAVIFQYFDGLTGKAIIFSGSNVSL